MTSIIIAFLWVLWQYNHDYVKSSLFPSLQYGSLVVTLLINSNYPALNPLLAAVSSESLVYKTETKLVITQVTTLVKLKIFVGDIVSTPLFLTNEGDTIENVTQMSVSFLKDIMNKQY